jgi:DNA-binding winged helix-turn-helix (wHTH) protein
MDTPDRNHAATSRIEFGRFALGPAHGSLRSGDRDLTLRPETWAVLKFLVEHPDRVVSREELLEAGWPGLISGEDPLAQSIDELRRVLGDPDARLIVAVPGDGYRFVSAAAPGERRKARGWHPLRWRWVYGILAPLLLAVTVAVLMLMSCGPDPGP